MTEPLRVHPAMLATTGHLVEVCTTAAELGYEHTLLPELAEVLDPHPEARHVLVMRALLDRVAGRPIEEYVRCLLTVKAVDTDGPLQQNFLDVRLRDYVALEVADYDRSAVTELHRALDPDALTPDHHTPRSTP